MYNKALLMPDNGVIGIAGSVGFGVGCYEEAPSKLNLMGLTPLNGYDNPYNHNYGNYRHQNGSIMVFIPAFCYRVGLPSAPSYKIDRENAIEICDANLAKGDGWILHRAFIDGGTQYSGFFIDKYICSKDSSGINAISIKNGDNISLHSSDINSSSMPNCSGCLHDAITLGRARGNQYSCVTAFQWSAIAMLSLAHGQASVNSRWCEWFDNSNTINFPKGNNSGLKDYNDSSVTWSAHIKTTAIGKTGSSNPFPKTTHNGQYCGVTDISGSQWQPLIGCIVSSSSIGILKESVCAHDVTKDNRTKVSLFDMVTTSYGGGHYYWGENAFSDSSSGTQRALCGIVPHKYQMNDNTTLFGNDYFYLDYFSDRALCTSGYSYHSANAGVWFRDFGNSWTDGNSYFGFRCSGYPK